MIVYKCLHGLAPVYLVNDCQAVSAIASKRHLRSADTGTLFVPRTTTTLGMRSFAVAGPHIWNSLPTTLWTATLSHLAFTRHLKSHLFDWDGQRVWGLFRTRSAYLHIIIIGGLWSYTCQKNWKWAHSWIGQCLGYLHAEANQNCSMLRSQILLTKNSVAWKNVEYCTLVASSGSHVTLSRHLLSFLVLHMLNICKLVVWHRYLWVNIYWTWGKECSDFVHKWLIAFFLASCIQTSLTVFVT